MSRPLWRKILAGILLVSTITLTGCREHGEEVADLSRVEIGRVKPGVVVVEATIGSLPIEVRGSGHIYLCHKTELCFEAPKSAAEANTVDRIYIKEGEVVEKGQVLAKLKSAAFEEEVTQRQIELSQREAELEFREEQLKEVEKESDKSHYMTDRLNTVFLIVNDAFTISHGTISMIISILNPALSDPYFSNPSRKWIENPEGQLIVDLPVPVSEPIRDLVDRASWLASHINAFHQLLNGILQGANMVFQHVEEYRDVGDYEDWKVEKVKQAQTQLVLSEHALESAQISLNDAQRILEGATLKAPFPGVVDEILGIEEGDKVSGNESIMTLVDPSEVGIEVSVGEGDIIKVKEGQKAKIWLDALPHVELYGKVKNIPFTADIEAGVVNYNVLVSMRPPPSSVIRLREGQSALVEIIVGEEKDVVLLPTKAVRLGGKVWVLREDSTIEERPVILGRTKDEYTQILSGLSGGESVVLP
jgi:multidrug efflux pump subunit AcrA (membrane-fusion protein)